jgi:hypothetical protein
MKPDALQPIQKSEILSQDPVKNLSRKDFAPMVINAYTLTICRLIIQNSRVFTALIFQKAIAAMG